MADRKTTSVMMMGTFDPLHEGHRHCFEYARGAGTELYVGVMSDEFIRVKKGREPMYDELRRIMEVGDDENVDFTFVVPEDDDLEFDVVAGLEPDIYYFGSATFNNLWNIEFQKKLKGRIPGIEFRVFESYKRDELNSTRIREERGYRI